MVHLNYAILLYNTGEKGQAAKQFDQFESKFRKFKHPNPDPEVPTMCYSFSTVAPYPGLASFPRIFLPPVFKAWGTRLLIPFHPNIVAATSNN